MDQNCINSDTTSEDLRDTNEIYESLEGINSDTSLDIQTEVHKTLHKLFSSKELLEKEKIDQIIMACFQNEAVRNYFNISREMISENQLKCEDILQNKENNYKALIERVLMLEKRISQLMIHAKQTPNRAYQYTENNNENITSKIFELLNMNLTETEKIERILNHILKKYYSIKKTDNNDIDYNVINDEIIELGVLYTNTNDKSQNAYIKWNKHKETLSNLNLQHTLLKKENDTNGLNISHRIQNRLKRHTNVHKLNIPTEHNKYHRGRFLKERILSPTNHKNMKENCSLPFEEISSENVCKQYSPILYGRSTAQEAMIHPINDRETLCNKLENIEHEIIEQSLFPPDLPINNLIFMIPRAYNLKKY